MRTALHTIRRGAAALACGAPVLLCLAVGCSYEMSYDFQTGGAMNRIGEVEFTSAGVDTAGGAADYAFGTISTSGTRTYAYIVAVSPEGEDSASDAAASGGRSSMKDGAFTSSYVMDLDGLEVSVDHSATVDVAKGTISDEKLVIQGVTVDLTKGRLFLLERDALPGEWTQMVAPLPTAPASIERLPGFTVEAIANLARSDESIAEFARR